MPLQGRPSRQAWALPSNQLHLAWKEQQSVHEDDVDLIRQQLENYRRLRDLVDEWIGLALELSRVRLRQRRDAADAKKNGPKNVKSQQTRKRQAGK